MKYLFKPIAYLILSALLLAGLCALAIWIALHALLEENPALSTFEKASLEDLKRIKVLALETSQQSNNQDIKSLSLSERDINLGIGHFGPKQFKLPASTFAKVNLNDSSGTVQATLPAPLAVEQALTQIKKPTNRIALAALNFIEAFSQDRWINIKWRVTIDSNQEKQEWIHPGKISIGSIHLTKSLSQDIAYYAYQTFTHHPSASLTLQTWENIRKLEIDKEHLNIQFVLPNNPNAGLASYQSLIFSKDEQANIQFYTNLINNNPKKGPLVKVLALLFEQAKQRSNQSLNPIAENRSVLLALSKAYGGDRIFNMLETSPDALFHRAPKPYSLYGRKDLAQHFILSAGLTLLADERLAELVGLSKEISDLYGGNTISAWDLLSDKAGVRLAENATRSAKSARIVQTTLSQARHDRHVLPDLSQEFEYSLDRFSTEDLDDLNVLVELYLEQHPILRKKI